MIRTLLLRVKEKGPNLAMPGVLKITLTRAETLNDAWERIIREVREGGLEIVSLTFQAEAGLSDLKAGLQSLQGRLDEVGMGSHTTSQVNLSLSQS